MQAMHPGWVVLLLLCYLVRGETISKQREVAEHQPASAEMLLLPETTTGFQSLPNELSHKVMQFTDGDDQASMRLVNRLLYQQSLVKRSSMFCRWTLANAFTTASGFPSALLDVNAVRYVPEKDKWHIRFPSYRDFPVLNGAHRDVVSDWFANLITLLEEHAACIDRVDLYGPHKHAPPLGYHHPESQLLRFATKLGQRASSPYIAMHYRFRRSIRHFEPQLLDGRVDAMYLYRPVQERFSLLSVIDCYSVAAEAQFSGHVVCSNKVLDILPGKGVGTMAWGHVKEVIESLGQSLKAKHFASFNIQWLTQERSMKDRMIFYLGFHPHTIKVLDATEWRRYVRP